MDNNELIAIPHNNSPASAQFRITDRICVPDGSEILRHYFYSVIIGAYSQYSMWRQFSNSFPSLTIPLM